MVHSPVCDFVPGSRVLLSFTTTNHKGTMTRTTSIEVDGLDLRSIAAKARIGNAQWRIAQTLKRLIEEHQAQCAGCDMQFIQLYEDCEVLGIPVL